MPLKCGIDQTRHGRVYRQALRVLLKRVKPREGVALRSGVLPRERLPGYNLVGRLRRGRPTDRAGRAGSSCSLDQLGPVEGLQTA